MTLEPKWEIQASFLYPSELSVFSCQHLPADPFNNYKHNSIQTLPKKVGVQEESEEGKHGQE